MPLTQIKNLNSGTLLGRWTLIETVAQLQIHSDLPNQITLPDSIMHEKRKAEWLASRILAYQILRRFTPGFYYLENNENGQPFFRNSSFRVSISHTQHQVAVLISDQWPVGIDIERVQSKVWRIKDKFLSASEKSSVGDNLEKLTIAWSAKETLYKLYGKKNILFSENLLLFPFQLGKTGCIDALIQTGSFQQNYTVYFELENEVVLTYCLDNKSPGLS